MEHKILLCLSGQISKCETQNFHIILNNHLNHIPNDGIVSHLWQSEYEEIKQEKFESEVNFVVSKDSYPFDEEYEEYISTEEFEYHKLTTRYTNGKNWDHEGEDSQIQRAFGCCKMSTGLTECFRFAEKLEDYDIFIRARYDLIYRMKLEIEKLIPYLKSKNPVVFIPKNICNYGLMDVFWVMNKPALKLFTNYLHDCREYSKNNKVFWSEPLLRFHLINMHNVKVYRFNFPCTLYQWNIGNNYDLVPNMQTNSITRDIKKFKHGEHIDSWFPL